MTILAVVQEHMEALHNLTPKMPAQIPIKGIVQNTDPKPLMIEANIQIALMIILLGQEHKSWASYDLARKGLVAIHESISEWIKDEANGIFVSPKNSMALAFTFIRMENDEATKKAFFELIQIEELTQFKIRTWMGHAVATNFTEIPPIKQPGDLAMTELEPQVPLRTESHTAIAPEPSNPGHDSLAVPITPLTTEREAIEYAKVQVRSGGWEDLSLDTDTRFNILLASRAVSDLAVAIALATDSNDDQAKAQIATLRGLAFDIGNRAATTARLSLDKDIQERVGDILNFCSGMKTADEAIDMLSQEVVFGSAVADWMEAAETEEV